MQTCMRLFIVALALVEFGLAVLPKEPCKLDPWLDGKPTNPAAKLRLNSNGVDLANALASENLTNFIKNVRVPDVQIFDITVFNVHVTRFEDAKFYKKLVRPNTVRWGFDKGLLAVNSGFKRKIRNSPSQEWQTVEANVTVSSTAVSMETTTTMYRDGDGRPVTSSTSCTAKMGAPTTEAHGNVGLTSLLEANKVVVINEVERMFQRLICGTTTFSMKDSINRVLKTYPSKVKLGGMNSPFVLDYGLTSNPEVVNKETAIEGTIKGLTYFRYPSAYSFYPPAISEVTGRNGGYMLDFYATDYIINGLLFTAFKENLLKFEATSKTLSQSVGNYLSLSCSTGSVCVGHIFPNVSRANGNSYVKARVRATKSPKATFINGDAYFTAQALMELELVENRKTTKIFSANSTCTFGSLVPKIDKSTLFAMIKIVGMPFSNVTPTKDLDLDDIKNLQSIFISIAEEIVNAVLSIGFPLPLVDRVSLLNPTVKLLPRTLYIGSNLTYSPEF